MRVRRTPRWGYALLLPVLASCSGDVETWGESMISDPLTSGVVTATLKLQSDWTSGYCADVTVMNTGSAGVMSWTVVVELNQSTPSSSWNATVSRSGTRLTATPVAFNAAIPAGGSASFGFCGNAAGSNYRPVLVSLSTTGGAAAGSGGSSGSGGRLGSGGATGSGGKLGSGGATGSGGKLGSGGSAVLPPVTLYLAGDSTVANVSSATPTFFGWGQQMVQSFKNVTVVNNAIGGRSIAFWMYQVARDSSGAYQCVDSYGHPKFVLDASGNKVDTTQWASVKSSIKPGDYFMVAFGANDATSTCPRHVSTADYKTYLGIMASAIRARGATPIFVTPASQLSGCSGSSGTPAATLTAYAAAAREAGAANNVPVIDLNTLSVQYYRSVGCASIYTVFTAGQSTHFTQAGAVAIARLVAQALLPLGSPLAAYLK